MVFRHFTVLAAAARVAQLLPDGSLEESLAALAADGAVMPSWKPNHHKRDYFLNRFHLIYI